MGTRSEMVPLVLLIVAIEICMWVFLGTDTPSSMILNLVTGGSLLGSQTFLEWIVSNLELAFGTALAGIAIGTLLVSGKSDFVFFAGIAALFLSYIPVFGHLYENISSTFDHFFTLAGGNFFAAIIVAPLIILYVFVILKLWRGTD